MIRIRLFGSNKLFFSLGILIFCLNACRIVKLSNTGEVRYDYMTGYTDDSFGLSIRLFGDYRLNKSNKVKKLKDIFWHSPLLPRRIAALLFAKTMARPYFDCLVLINRKQNRNHYLQSGYELISTNSDTIYRNIHPILIKDEMIDQYVVPLKNYDLGILAYASASDNKDYTPIQLLNSCREEFKQIAISVKNAPSPDLAVSNPFALADSAFSTAVDGNYLLPIVKLKQEEDDLLSTEGSADLYYQAMATYMSFIGDYKDEFANLSKWMHSDTKAAKSIDIDKEKLHPVDSTLSGIYLSNQVVMFNESHFEPKHRLFVARQLSILKSAGFKYLALEALSGEDLQINTRRFPTLSSGFYVREYNMANLMRTALALGFTLVSYDDIEKSGQQREEEQARQIYRKTIEKDRKAKVVVLAGHSHIDESGSTAWMAKHFQKISHINPATINQTRYSETELLKINTGASTSSILFKNDFPEQAEMNTNDFYIVNKEERENDLYLGAALQYSDVVISVPDSVLQQDSEKVLLIYLKQETEACKMPLPCFTRKMAPKQEISINIPSGNYVVRIKDAGDHILYQNELSVK